MIELWFQRDLYDPVAVDEAVALYGAYGCVELARGASEDVVRVTVGAEHAEVDEATLSAELCNYALGLTVERANAAGVTAGEAHA